MACSVMVGKERDGLSRRACSFQDGILIQRVEVEGNRLVVTDPLNKEHWRSEPLAALNGYAVQSLDAVRSGQTGRLVVTIGGFYAGSSKQRPLVVATDYAIRQPITHEEYLAGQR